MMFLSLFQSLFQSNLLNDLFSFVTCYGMSPLGLTVYRFLKWKWSWKGLGLLVIYIFVWVIEGDASPKPADMR